MQRIWRNGSLLLIVVMVSCLLAGANRQQSVDQIESVKKFMRPKLGHAQKLLEGLTLENFELIQSEAQALSLLSREAEWNVLQTEDYLLYSSEFRRAADAIRDAANKKNLDGAALAYVEMTMKCVNCHKYVRGVKMADIGHPVRSPKIR